MHLSVCTDKAFLQNCSNTLRLLRIKELFSYSTISHISSDSYFEQHPLITIISRISGVSAFIVPGTKSFPITVLLYKQKQQHNFSWHNPFLVTRNKWQHLNLQLIQDVKGSLLIPYSTAKIQLLCCKIKPAVICTLGKRCWKVINSEKWRSWCPRSGRNLDLSFKHV